MNETLEEVAEAAANVGSSFFTTTTNMLNWGKSLLTWENLFKLIGAIIIFAIIFVIYKLLLRAIKKIPAEKTTPQRTAILKRTVKYLFYAVTIIYVLSLFGIKLSAIWGAAGIAGVAIGFAAQTSVSNLISGLFVITEGALKIGDTIIVDGVTGVVDAINLISVRIHTYDNQMVRIPNSTIINTNLTNNSYHKTRRLTLQVSVSYDTDMEQALQALSKAPALCPTVISDPAPAVWFDGFGSSGLTMTVAVWFESSDFLQTKNDLHIAIKKVLDQAQITIPFNKVEVKILEK
jgi:small-conductance mechanosensitive channel